MLLLLLLLLLLGVMHLCLRVGRMVELCLRMVRVMPITVRVGTTVPIVVPMVPSKIMVLLRLVRLEVRLLLLPLEVLRHSPI